MLIAGHFLGAIAACGASVSEPVQAADTLEYRIDYTVTPAPADGTVAVTLQLSQPRALLRELSFAADERILAISGDGVVENRAGRVHWRPPASGGQLRWNVRVAHLRNDSGYDAWLGTDWGVFRGNDIIPRAASRTLRGARSDTWLRFRLPGGWSAVTRYFEREGRFHTTNRGRRFDQPSGWMVIGRLGVRRDNVAGVRVAVAGPVDQSVRRMDILAMLSWTLPELARLLPELPPRLTVVSAGDPMWRGGLSGPGSLFLHADRPMISENATSTLMHEVVHTSLGLTARREYDWIVEGLAEYYGLEILRRSGTISEQRFMRARASLASWARSAKSLCAAASTAETTALAVTILFDLDEQIREASGGTASLDDVTHEIAGLDTAIDLEVLTAVATRFAGAQPDALRIENLPGCPPPLPEQ